MTGQVQEAGPCPVCGELGAWRDTRVLEGRRLKCCGICGAWVVFPRPTLEDLRTFYNRPAYFEHPYFQVRRANETAAVTRHGRLFNQLETGGFSWQGTIRRMLDIGCDTGLLMKAMRKRYGLQVEGIEISSRAAAIARARGETVFEGAVEEAPPEWSGYHLITALDVLEHLVNPAEVVQSCFRRLLPGGWLYLETPNLQSAVYRLGLWFCRWSAGKPAPLFNRLFPLEHVVHIDRRGIQRLAHQVGFDVCACSGHRLSPEELALAGWKRAMVGLLQGVDRIRGEGLIWGMLLRRPDRPDCIQKSWEEP